MKHQILIEELMPTESNVIIESRNDAEKSLYLNGIFMQSTSKNRNGRIYPLSEINSAVVSAQQRIKESNGIFGELDHPNTLQIQSDRVSHVITDIHMEGNNAMGKMKILNTPMGRIARELIESGVKIGVSSRGAGTVTEDTGTVSGFNFVTCDIVITPSCMAATPGAVYESLLDSTNGKKVLTLAEQLRDDKSAQKFFEREMRKFIEKLTR